MESLYDVDPSEAPNNAKEKGKKNKKLVKKGFINYKIKKSYSKDIHSSSISTNKSRWERLLFLAYQLARDAGVELLLFGYFPNDMVGSCGSWSFGKITKLLKKKPDTTKYYNYWETFFSLIEAQRQNKETFDVEKCHEAATFNFFASENMDSDGASDVENESEDADVEKESEDADVEKESEDADVEKESEDADVKNESEDADMKNESEVEALEEIVIPSDEKNSMETLESVEFESVDQLQRWLNSANATESSVTETEIILTIDPETSTVSFPTSLQNATVTAKTQPPPAFKVPDTRMSSVSVTFDDKATRTLTPTPLATKYPATTPLPTDSSSTPFVSLGAICVNCAAKVSETLPATKDPASSQLPKVFGRAPSAAKAEGTPTLPATKDPATTSPPTNSDLTPSVPLDVTFITSAVKASKTQQATKDPPKTSLTTYSDPVPSVPLDITFITSAVKASKTQQATKDPPKTSLTTYSDPVPSVPLDITCGALAAKASKTPQTTKDPASPSLTTDSNPAPSDPLGITCVALAVKASKTQQATKDQATTSLPTDSNPAPAVSAASAIIRNQPPRSHAKKRTITKVLASTPLPAESSPTPSVSATLIAKRKQPPLKKAKKAEVEAK
ncbi:mucin-2 [Daphnia magna]|uniref:mucin-2 n=1 Tax=Daphnia magna TaxID=35525 RepID=UPI001E1BCAB7|nr:mucin-2 [Daphnia magna]